MSPEKRKFRLGDDGEIEGYLPGASRRFLRVFMGIFLVFLVIGACVGVLTFGPGVVSSVVDSARLTLTASVIVDSAGPVRTAFAQTLAARTALAQITPTLFFGPVTATPHPELAATQTAIALQPTRIAPTLRPTVSPLPLSQSRQVYFSNFEENVGAEWSASTTDLTPSGRRFLGQFSNGLVRLSLDNLPPHSEVIVSFDLFILRSWDGLGAACSGCGPDVWGFQVDGGTPLLQTTFSNTRSSDPAWDQAYPDPYPGGAYPAFTGAVETNTLGYRDPNAIYWLSFTIPHRDKVLGVVFFANGLQDLADEGWGIDNVEIRIVPQEPDTVP